jgi:hypothetical protein
MKSEMASAAIICNFVVIASGYLWIDIDVKVFGLQYVFLCDSSKIKGVISFCIGSVVLVDFRFFFEVFSTFFIRHFLARRSSSVRLDIIGLRRNSVTLNLKISGTRFYHQNFAIYYIIWV